MDFSHLLLFAPPHTQATGNVIQGANGQEEEEEMLRKFSRPVLEAMESII